MAFAAFRKDTPTGTALTHWHCAGAQRQCKCAQTAHRTCDAPQVRCRWVLGRDGVWRLRMVVNGRRPKGPGPSIARTGMPFLSNVILRPFRAASPCRVLGGRHLHLHAHLPRPQVRGVQVRISFLATLRIWDATRSFRPPKTREVVAAQ